MSNFIAPKSKLFAHLPTLHEIQQGRRPPPISLELDASWRCSHGCEFCHYAYTHTRGPLKGTMDKPKGAIDGGDLLDFDLAKDILRQVAEYGVKSVTWSGGGEPTLNPHINDLVRHAASVGLQQGMYTHGGHMDDERAALFKSTLTWVYVSLDECTAESFKRTKGVNRFDAVLAGVRRLVAAQGDAVVGLGFMLHENNVNDVHDMVRLGRELGVTYVQFRPVIRFEQDRPNVMVEPDVSWILRAIGLLNAYRGDSFVIADKERFREYADWNGHGYEKCWFSAIQTVITPNGKVWRCTNKREHPDALLGDLAIESFATLWARSGGPCQVNSQCRTMCIGHMKNEMMTPIMAPQVHADFV